MLLLLFSFDGHKQNISKEKKTEILTGVKRSSYRQNKWIYLNHNKRKTIIYKGSAVNIQRKE